MINPFLHEVVVSPWDQPEADVPEIHRQAFERCVQLFERTQSRKAQSVLLNGEAGSGKTHLLARLRKYVESRQRPDHKEAPGIFIAVRMDCPASHVWRHLRKRFFGDLLRQRQDGTTALEAALLALERQTGQSLSNILDAQQIELNLSRILERYHCCQQRRECRSWLQGQPLTDRDLQRLDVATDDSRLEEEESQEVQAKDRVMQVAGLLTFLPMVFCFDQVEALEAYPGDQRGLAAFSLMASEIAELPNSLTLLSIQTSFLPKLEEIAQRPELDRAARERLAVGRLSYAEGEALLRRRIDAAPEVRSEHPDEPLGPLPVDEVKGFFQQSDGFPTARELIHFASELFDKVVDGTLKPKAPRPEFLRQQLDKRWQDSPALKGSGETDEIVLHGLQLVSGLDGVLSAGSPPERFRRDISLQMGPDHAPVYLVMLNQQHGLAVTNRLKRLKNALAPAERARLRLIRDSRLQIAPTAKKGLCLLNKMEQEGARLVQPGAETLAALDAVRSLLADAQSGDLAHEGSAVEPESVRKWLAEKLPDSVRDLIEQISGKGEPAPVELLEFVQQRRVVRASEAAERLGMAEERVIEHARHNPDAVRVLAGPPPILFYYVPAAVGGELAET